MATRQHIVPRMLAGIFFLVLAILMAVQYPAVQTDISNSVLNALEKHINGKIQVGKINIRPLHTLVIKDLVITDNEPLNTCIFPTQDTLAKINSLIASYRLGNQKLGTSFKLHSVVVDGGEFNLVVDDNVPNINKIFNIVPVNESMDTTALILRIGKVRVKDFRFRMFNTKIAGKFRDLPPGKINWSDLDGLVNVRGKKMTIEKGYITGIVDNVSLFEKSGYSVSNISGEVLVGQGITMIENLKIKDEFSDIHLKHYAMLYEGPQDFAKYTDKVTMDIELAPSIVDFKTIEYFAPTLNNTSVRAMVYSTKANGTVNNLSVKNFVFKDKSGVGGKADCRITETEHPDKLAINGTVYSADFDSKSISLFLNGLSGKGNVDFSKFAVGQPLKLKATASGPLNSLDIKALISTLDGTFSTDFNVRNAVARVNPIGINGVFSANDLDIGKLAGIDILGKCSFDTGLSAVIGNETDNTSAVIDSLKISSLQVLGYDYSGIAAAGKLQDASFDGRIICSDPNLNFLFQGKCNLSKDIRNAIYKFYFNLGYADLNALHLDKRGKSLASFALNANYMLASKQELIGNIDIKDLTLENISGIHRIGNLSLTSHSNDDIVRASFKSSFANGSYAGTKSIVQFIDGLKNTTIRRELPVIEKIEAVDWTEDEFNLSLNFHDSRDLLSFVKPGLYIADGTSFNLGIDSCGILNADIKSQRIALGTNFFKNLTLKADNTSDMLSCKVNGEELKIGPVSLHDNSLSLSAKDNGIGLAFSYYNGGDNEDQGEIVLTGDMSRCENDSLRIDARNLISSISHNNQKWIINPATFTIDRNGVNVDSLLINKAGSEILVNGGYSKAVHDTLALNLKEIYLKDIASILGSNIDIAGDLNGSARIISASENDIPLLANIRIDSTRLSGRDAGNLEFACLWDNNEKGFNIIGLDKVENIDRFKALCFYKPDEQIVRASVSLNRFNIGYAESFLPELFNGLDGTASGEINLNGTLDNIDVSSKGCRFENVKMQVAANGVSYNLNGPFHLDNSGLFIDDFTITDENDGYADLSGGILYNNFKDMTLDFGLSLNNLQVLQLKEKQNPSLYGNLKTSGTVRCSGPFASIGIDADISTSDEGEIHIPLGGSLTSTSTNLLSFKTNDVIVIDPYEEMMDKMKEDNPKSKSDLAIKARANIRDNVDLIIEIDKATGNIIRGRGTGSIQMDMVPSKGRFSLDGDYNLTSGKYHFAALGLTSKDFTIGNGSSIKFGGDLADTDLDIFATYIAKASLGNLIADTTSVAGRRNVECGIHISDKLRNPHLDFSVEIPDLDPITKSSVQSALNTDDKIQRQFLSLLLTNNFLPNEQSGIVNNTSLIYSNVSDIMANQLSNILQKLDIPLDLGFNYQPGQGGTDIFDVAVSTQLFNNRVSVNGNIGNRQNRSSGNKSDVVGDLDIEVKLDKAGALRMTLFSHSADQFTNYLDYSQRNGLGMTYQKEFNSFKSLWHSIFLSKDQRKEKEKAQIVNELTSKKKVITIENNE